MTDLSDFREKREASGGFDLGGLDLDRVRQMFRWGAMILGLLLLWSAIGAARSFYTDWLWFQELGYEAVLLKIVTARAILFAGALALVTAVGLGWLYVASRSTDRPPRPAAPIDPLQYHFIHRLVTRTAAAAILGFGLVMALPASAQWEPVLMALEGVAFGEAEPIFERDFSFYVFTLPALRLGHQWLVGTLVGLGLIVGAYFYLTDRIRGESQVLRPDHVRRLAVFGVALFLLIAAGHWLSRYELLFSPTGTVFGVGFTDDHVNLPARTFLSLTALAVAGVMAYAAFARRSTTWLVGPAAAWLVLVLVAGSLAPAIVQRLRVEPSELAAEREYLANNIEYTRKAFGLDDLRSMDHPARGEIGRATIAENQGTIRNIRLWDEGPLLQSYNQIQFFRLYYDFLAVHTDRYEIDGELRQVMLATRELSAEKLPAEAQRWVNRRLQFTHGYGVAMSPVTEVEAGGRPSFFVSDVPPVGPIPLDRPEIYYGLRSLEYVIANSGMQEFNYPGQEGPEYTHYGGTGGVELSSFFKRLIYAWEFGDLNILISGEIGPESRLQYDRTVAQRVGTIAPFLQRDGEAYAVVADGRVRWIQDAYTVTNRYPYATRWNGRFNYIRNSVKAVIDAYDGDVDFYVFDPDDPLVRTYQKIFPGLFQPREAMPESLRRHVRFPLDLFTVQTRMLLQYHMRDPVVFYNKEDQWDVPIQTSFGRSTSLRPYYIVARLPGEPREEFLLIQPFTPDDRHNLVGWMAARSDGERYGELVLFQFPTGRHVDGPNQIEARIDNDAVISEQFTLWGQVGSEVSRGILLVVPMGDAILYAEPVFLKPETLEFPELRRIILADASDVVMHPTLDESVDALIGELPPVAPLAEVEVPREPGEDVDTAAGDGAGEGTEPAATDSALVDDLRRSLRRTIEELEGMLDRLERRSN